MVLLSHTLQAGAGAGPPRPADETAKELVSLPCHTYAENVATWERERAKEGQRDDLRHHHVEHATLLDAWRLVGVDHLEGDLDDDLLACVAPG